MPETPSEKNSKEKNPFSFEFKNACAKKGLTDQFNTMNVDEMTGMNIDVESLFENQEKLKLMYQNDAVKICYLFREISKLPHVDDFALSINMIISSIKIGKFGKLADILGELKILMMHAKSLMKNADDTKKLALKNFVAGLDGVINRKAFE